jgi:hypothetical protein
MSKLSRLSHHKVALLVRIQGPWVPAVQQASSHISLDSAPHRQRDSSSTLLGGQVLFTQLAQDFTWLGRNSRVSMHVLPNGQRRGCSKAGWSTHCTQTHQQSTPCPLAFTTLTEPPPFFTPRVDSQDCAVQGAGPVAGRPVLLLPMRPCHWALASQKSVRTGHTGTSNTEPWANGKGFHQVLLACSCFLSRDDTVYAWPRVTHTIN